jgi:hypothetical protein
MREALRFEQPLMQTSLQVSLMVSGLTDLARPWGRVKCTAAGLLAAMAALYLIQATAESVTDSPQSWVSVPHKLGWAALIAIMLAYELYTLRWNKRHPGKRANLSSYVQAFFRAGERRLKYSAGGAILIATFVYFTGHFLRWWG